MPILGVYIFFGVPTLPYSFSTLDALYLFPDNAKIVLYIVLGILTFVAPLISLIIMKYSGMIPNLKLEKKEDRNIPFVITIFYYLLAFIYVRFQFPEEFQHPALLGFLFGALIIFVTLFIVNFYVKVSLHTAGIFALVGGLLGYFQTQNLIDNHDRMLFFIFFLIGVGGLISAGRVYLKAHTLGEATLGMFIGFIVAFVSVRFGIFI